MIIMNVMLDNVFCFKDATLNFTYPRKLTNAPLEMEYLKERPNFRFKRVCILSGGNASGKTAFGKMLCIIQNLVSGSPSKHFPSAINNKKKKASFSVDFVTPSSLVAHRYMMVVDTNGLVEEEYSHVPIGKNDSYEITAQKLDNIKHGGVIKNSGYFYNNTPSGSYVSRIALDGKMNIDTFWYYVFNGDHNKTRDEAPKDKVLFEKILVTFDQSIEKVSDLGKGDYRIIFKNKDSVIVGSNGDVAGKDRLSLGTYEAIGTTAFLEAVIGHQGNGGLFFLDESMAYVHSELEKTIINLLIAKLNDQSQLFITTHNYDVLDMNLPIHSFVFLKKEELYTEFIKPEDSFKKNDRSLINYIQNDVFGTLPDTSGIDDLL